MSKTEKGLLIVAGVILALLVSLAAWVNCTHVGRAAWNLWFGTVQKVDDATSYETRKKVEDTCRAMVSSYEADKLTWQQYRDSDSEEKQNWAEQAKMRANKTAATYNNYILENSYVWSGNVPDDIKGELEYLE
jgi:hypothetical protein